MLLAAATPGAGHGQSAPLYEVPTEMAAGAGSGTPYRARLFVQDPKAAAESLSLTWPRTEIHEGAVTVDLERAARASDPPLGEHSQASFIIDFDTEAVQGLLRQLREQQGAKPSYREIEAFVDRAITNKSLARGWDLASKVAQRLEGDCTEHAVLSTALGRAVGWPSRVVVGVVLVPEGKTARAFGHAWAESFDGDSWRLLDAALRGEPGPRYYLPLNRLGREGPGYAFDLAVSFQRTSPSKLELLGRPP